MTTILTATPDGVAITSSLGDAKVGRWCSPPNVPDRCYRCFDVVDGSIRHRKATGYIEEHVDGRTTRYGTCPACWAERARYRYKCWAPTSTCVYDATLDKSGKWRVCHYGGDAALFINEMIEAGYLEEKVTGPYHQTTVWLTEKALAGAVEFFYVKDAEGDLRRVYADGSPFWYQGEW